MRRGAGGVTRNSHQITGSATSAASSHGDANASDPSDSIAVSLSLAPVRRQRSVQREQRREGGRSVRCAPKDQPTAWAIACSAVAMLAKPPGIGVADGLDAADRQLAALLDALEAHPAVKRQILLGRIDDLQQMPGEPGRGKAGDEFVGRVEGPEEIADQDQLCVARQRSRCRQAARRRLRRAR